MHVYRSCALCISYALKLLTLPSGFNQENMIFSTSYEHVSMAPLLVVQPVVARSAIATAASILDFIGTPNVVQTTTLRRSTRILSSNADCRNNAKSLMHFDFSLVDCNAKRY